MDGNRYISETLGFWKYKVDNGLCTPSEIRSVEKALLENTELNASIEDLANYFGTSEQNIRTAISRKLLAKPKRKVLYPFQKFLRIVTPNMFRKKTIAE